MITIAVLVPLLWLGWLALIDWVPLFPLNDLRPDNVRERRVAALANYPVPLLIAAGVALDRDWSRLAALGLCGLCLAGHLVSWWLPYFGPGTAGQRETYAREYARTWKVLPTAGHAVVIDVQHMVVGALTLAMLGTTLAATLVG
jgi:hypothetical protein